MFRDLLNEAYGAMQYNRRRTALTMLGMAWGIATVVLLLAYGNGFGRACANIFASFGTKLMIMVPGRTSMQAGGQKAGAPVRFTLDDLDTLSNNIPQITQITPEAFKQANIQYETRTFNFQVTGNYPNVLSIRALKLAEGRFYNREDEMQHGRVAVIGSEAKEKLFSGRNALGERIRVDGLSVEVVGILGPKMQAGDDNANRVIYLPFTTMSDVKDTHYLDAIWFDYETPAYEGLEKTVREVMAVGHKFSPADRRAIMVFNLMDQVHQFELITLGLTILLGFIGTLTLGIGGVGLMNIMLVSVTQRTREIGVEKALGARRRHILLQFLAESLTITFIGGVLGIILAYGVSLSVGRLTLYSAVAKNAEAGDVRLIIAPGTLLVATVILGAVGLISGMVPAVRASRLDPIEALRYE
ncbi:MAG TPA: ABC transporter permease [Terriglobales bacterium]|jgi:putative ABC transport system permease protein|nr:ABC transporter permease [Terriglobales bacterium]